jgi:hypothetical protein
MVSTVMPTPVTDPDILAQLNGGPQPVTDPHLLAQLNGADAPLPDVGEPAIGDGGPFSPGLPSVNAAANSASQTVGKAASNLPHSAAEFAKNAVQPFLHPIDTATGLKDLGLGVLEKTGIVPGSEHEKYADAVGKFFADRYGSLDAARKTLEEDPVGMAGDLSMLLYGGSAAAARLAGRAGAAAKVAAPTTKELFKSSADNYATMHNYGVELHPHIGDAAADAINTELQSAGYRDFLAPKTFRMVEELRNPVGANLTTQDIEAVRRGLNKAARDPAERDAARRAVGTIDDALASLTPADAAVNGHFADKIAEAATAARGDYAAAKRSELIDKIRSKAERQAAKAGTGANIDNTMRQRVDSLLNDDRKLRGFTDAEKAAMQDVVKGSTLGNAARYVGKLAPTGVVSAMGAGAGYATHGLPGAIGTAGVGYAAKKIADRATANRLLELSHQVRSRSPLARQNPPTPPASNVPNPMNLLVPRQAGQVTGINPYE